MLRQGTALPRNRLWISPARCSSCCWRRPFAGAIGDGKHAARRRPQPVRRPAAGVHARRREIIANLARTARASPTSPTTAAAPIYGCRSGAGGTAKGNEPCVRANNLADGLAFEFNSNGGDRGRHHHRPEHERRAVHDERDRRGHRPERRQGRRQGRSDDRPAGPNRSRRQRGRLRSSRAATPRPPATHRDRHLQRRLRERRQQVRAHRDQSTARDPGDGHADLTDTVQVRTRSTTAGTAADRPFHLAVTC